MKENPLSGGLGSGVSEIVDERRPLNPAVSNGSSWEKKNSVRRGSRKKAGKRKPSTQGPNLQEIVAQESAVPNYQNIVRWGWTQGKPNPRKKRQTWARGGYSLLNIGADVQKTFVSPAWLWCGKKASAGCRLDHSRDWEKEAKNRKYLYPG